ncbi:MAG: hypothetical protein WDZ53_00725 [Balneolales bacterium]
MLNHSTINLSQFQSRAAGERPGLSIPGGDQRQLEIHENNFVRDKFKPVWNFRGGLTVNHCEHIEPRLGYARLDNPVRFKENNIRQYVSAGVGIGVHQILRLDLGLQYGFWKETESLYTVDEATRIIAVDGDPVTFTEYADMDVRRFHATIGLSIRL